MQHVNIFRSDASYWPVCLISLSDWITAQWSSWCPDEDTSHQYPDTGDFRQPGSEITCSVQRAANIEQRYFCRRKIDVFVHICVYAENKRCILQLSYLYGISAYLGFHSQVQRFLIKAFDAMSFICTENPLLFKSLFIGELFLTLYFCG